MIGENQEVRYLTDDRDSRCLHELIIMPGGNGDWYIGVAPEGEFTPGRMVRICTSGGAARRVPGVGQRIAEIYRILAEYKEKQGEAP